MSSNSWRSPKRVAVTVRGEVDASNAEEFARAVCETAVGFGRVTLDLSEVDFIALDGVPALHAINARLMRAGASWTIAPGPAVTRLLELCDPVGLLPIAPTSDHSVQPA